MLLFSEKTTADIGFIKKAKLAECGGIL